MESSGLSPVFKDFLINSSFKYNDDIKKNQLENLTLTPSGNNDEKSHNSHTALKILLGGLLITLATSVIVPFVRHKKFPQVNPNLIKPDNNYKKFAKNYINFSDNLEVRRDIIFEYIKGKFAGAKEFIRKNFFSYNQKEPEVHTPLKKAPKAFVGGIIKEVNNFINICSKIGNKIDIDYTQFNKTL